MVDLQHEIHMSDIAHSICTIMNDSLGMIPPFRSRGMMKFTQTCRVDAKYFGRERAVIPTIVQLPKLFVLAPSAGCWWVLRWTVDQALRRSGPHPSIRSAPCSSSTLYPQLDFTCSTRSRPIPITSHHPHPHHHHHRHNKYHVSYDEPIVPGQTDQVECLPRARSVWSSDYCHWWKLWRRQGDC
jgi:hypothetical protein